MFSKQIEASERKLVLYQLSSSASQRQSVSPKYQGSNNHSQKQPSEVPEQSRAMTVQDEHHQSEQLFITSREKITQRQETESDHALSNGDPLRKMSTTDAYQSFLENHQTANYSRDKAQQAQLNTQILKRKKNSVRVDNRKNMEQSEILTPLVASNTVEINSALNTLLFENRHHSQENFYSTQPLVPDNSMKSSILQQQRLAMLMQELEQQSTPEKVNKNVVLLPNPYTSSSISPAIDRIQKQSQKLQLQRVGDGLRGHLKYRLQQKMKHPMMNNQQTPHQQQPKPASVASLGAQTPSPFVGRKLADATISSIGSTGRPTKTVVAPRQLQMSDRVTSSRHSVPLTQQKQQQQQENQTVTKQTSFYQQYVDNSNAVDSQVYLNRQQNEENRNVVLGDTDYTAQNSQNKSMGHMDEGKSFTRRKKPSIEHSKKGEIRQQQMQYSAKNEEISSRVGSGKAIASTSRHGHHLSKSTKGSIQSAAMPNKIPENEQHQMKRRESNSKFFPVQNKNGFTRLEMHEHALMQGLQSDANQQQVDTSQMQNIVTTNTEQTPTSNFPATRTHQQIFPTKTDHENELLVFSSRQASNDELVRQTATPGNAAQSQRNNPVESNERVFVQVSMLPESIFTANKQQQEAAENQAVPKPNQAGWKHIHQTQRRTEISSWAQGSNNSSFQPHMNNQSQDRANSYGNGRSPYTQMPQTTSMANNFVNNSSDSKTNRHTSNNKILNSSLSIENERNRIQDVVKTSSFGPQIGRTDCTASPLYRQGKPASNEHEFDNLKQAKTTVSRNTNSNNFGIIGSDEGHKMTPIAAHGQVPQSTSAKKIPQISNMQNLAVQMQQQQLQVHQNQKNLSRGLYQTTTNSKYNFITPMILSDLHHISSIQQTRSDMAYEEQKYEDAKACSPATRNGANGGAPLVQQPNSRKQDFSQEIAKVALKSVQISSNNNSRQAAVADQNLQYSVPVTSQIGKVVKNNQAIRPQSGQFRRHQIGSANLKIVQQNKKSIDTYPNQKQAFVHSNRHLKTPVLPPPSQSGQNQQRNLPSTTTHEVNKQQKGGAVLNGFQAQTSTSSDASQQEQKGDGAKIGDRLDMLTLGEKRQTPKLRGHKTRNGKGGRTSHLKKSKGKSSNARRENPVDFDDNTCSNGLVLSDGVIEGNELAQNAFLEEQQLHLNVSPLKRLQLSPSSSLLTLPVDATEGSITLIGPQLQLNADDLGWSMASIESENQTAQLSDSEEQKETNTTQVTIINAEKVGEEIVVDSIQDADYVNENRLVSFNKHTNDRDQLGDDPIFFAMHKVFNHLVQNPINQRFVQKNKGQLPTSVFKPHASQVTFLKSIFEGRPPVAFFQYPSYVGIKRVADRIRMYNRDEVEHLFMSFRISDAAHIYNAVVNSCKAAGLTMLETNKSHLFNLQWTGYIAANDIKHLNKYQKTNHFPGSSQLGRKDLLWRNMSRMRSRFPKDFVITPMSYLIHEEYEAFQAERDRDPSSLWILKPVAASCGRGIKIYNSTQRVSKKEGMLAAKYISNPHLLNDLKYDMRVYVLVTSFNPLRIYMYNDGLVRFATEKYSNDPRKLQMKYVHLTNFSINKKNMNFVKNKDQAARNKLNSATGTTADEDQQEFDQNQSKWDFKMLRQAYEKQGINYEYVIAQFKDLIVKTLLCVEPHVTQNLQKNPTSRVNCFELYGFDILVDSNQKPWVLEVNVLPSLSSSSPFDKRIKTMLICDTLTLVGIRGYDKQKFHSQTTELLGLAPFAQSMTLSELRQKPRLTGHERLSKDELEMLMDLDEEFMRRGNFQRIFPLASNAAFYDQFFETKRYQNALCGSYLTSPQHIRDQLLYKYRRIYNSQV